MNTIFADNNFFTFSSQIEAPRTTPPILQLAATC